MRWCAVRAMPGALKMPKLASWHRMTPHSTPLAPLAPLAASSASSASSAPITFSSRPAKNQAFDPVRHPNSLNTYLSLSTASNVPLLTLWTASWCPSCRHVEPLIRSLILESRVGEDRGGINYVPVEFDSPEAGSLATDYLITSIPTLLAFDARKGEPASRIVDARKLADRQFLIDWINEQAGSGGKGHDGRGGGSVFGGLFGSWK